MRQSLIHGFMIEEPSQFQPWTNLSLYNARIISHLTYSESESTTNSVYEVRIEGILYTTDVAAPLTSQTSLQYIITSAYNLTAICDFYGRN
jgi:predicted SAM-dependent methyltransferase